MTDDSLRSVSLSRLSSGEYEATNRTGTTLRIGGEGAFSPVELLLAAIAGCSAIDVDLITGKRAQPSRFEATMTGDKIRDDRGNRLVNLALRFDIEFPDDDGGQAARDVLPRALQQTHDRLCTVSRTVEVGTPVEITEA